MPRMEIPQNMLRSERDRQQEKPVVAVAHGASTGQDFKSRTGLKCEGIREIRASLAITICDMAVRSMNGRQPPYTSDYYQPWRKV